MRAALIAAVLILIALAAVLGVDRVGEGEAVVVVPRFGGEPRVLLRGVHWTPPLVFQKGRYPLGPSALAVSLEPGEIVSAEGDPVGLDIEVAIEITPDLLPALQREFGPRFRDTLLEQVTSRARELLDRQPLAELYLVKWAAAGPQIFDALSGTSLGRDSGLRAVTIKEVRIDPGTRGALLATLGKSADARVVILGIDGADWNLIRPLLDRGELPNLRRLIREGSSAQLETLQPMLSPLIWTSIVTGKTPDKHGILDFFADDPATGTKVPVTSNLRRVKALWNILSEMEIQVCFIDWLASWPAEPVDGVLVSDRVAYHSFDPSPENYQAARKTYPEELLGSLTPLIVGDGDVTYGDVRPFLNIDASEFQSHVGGRYDPADPIQNFRLLYATTETYRKIGLDLARPSFRVFGIYFELLDAACHLFIKSMPPAMDDVSPEDARKFGRAVEETYRYQDRILGELLKVWDTENTTVIVLSDHGFRSGPLRLKSSSRIHGAGGAAAEWHRPFGFLTIRGPHFRRGFEMAHASVLDITPTVLYVLGLPVAEDMDGRVLTEAMDPEWVAAHPVLRISTYESGKARGPEAPIASADDQALRERLAALGYVDQDGANVHNNLAQSYLERGEFEKALSEYRRAIELEPKSARLWSNLGMAYLRMESYEEAIEPLKRSLELKPDFDAALSNLAVAYTYLGRFEEAAAVMEKAVELEPARAEFRDNLGVIYSRLGRKEKALECFRSAAALEPKFPEPYNNLGAMAMDVGSLDEARDSFRRAIALGPEFFDARYNLGLLEMKVGNTAEAIKALEAAVRIKPRHAEAHFQLGEAYAKMNEMEKARREWERAAEIDREGPTGRQAAARLEGR